MTRLLMAACVLLAASLASAQDAPKIGLTIAYPSSVGVLWNAAERLALRPEFAWSKTTNESPAITDPLLGTIGSATTFDSWQVGTGVSALFYVATYENLRTYVSPRLAYSRTSSSAGVPGTLTSSSGTASIWSTTGSFGAQYSLGRRFGLFGEIGMNYQSTTSRSTVVETRTTLSGPITGPLIPTTTTSTITSETHAHSISTRSGVGVIVFF